MATRSRSAQSPFKVMDSEGVVVDSMNHNELKWPMLCLKRCEAIMGLLEKYFDEKLFYKGLETYSSGTFSLAFDSSDL